MKKTVLSETILFSGDIPKKLKVDDKDYLIHILKSHGKNSYLSDNSYHYTSLVKPLEYIKYNTFIFEWIEQHFSMMYNKPLSIIQEQSLILSPNQKTIPFHQQNNYNFEKAIDNTMYYVADCDEAEIILHYDNHKWRDLFKPIKLKPRQFLFFNSDTNHYIVNQSKDKELVLINTELMQVVRN